eukprot:CAMPEP_0169387702 /NCGR_PEP_ID=MMETSP1017-20121227/45568_1 /TAXON_ID=342587 /ORGANISM="Karlodinium micrum, Strain CCMP2283" /LENGTH=195 /DNA_ID=CAMNT_0009489277 /DNA_START=54 /DNA_END=638 /DNA_ORIENTATION=-
MQANVPVVSQLSVPALVSSTGCKPPSLAAFVAAPGMGLVRTRSAESPRVVRPAPTQEALTVPASPTDLGIQLQRARQSASELTPTTIERSSSEPLVVSSAVARPVLETPAATLQIVHVSTQEETAEVSFEAIASSAGQPLADQARDQADTPTAPRKHRPSKAQSREDEGSTAPHVVLSLQSDKHTFLRKGSGTGG